MNVEGRATRHEPGGRAKVAMRATKGTSVTTTRRQLGRVVLEIAIQDEHA
jgi:hypothetical protein